MGKPDQFIKTASWAGLLLLVLQALSGAVTGGDIWICMSAWGELTLTGEDKVTENWFLLWKEIDPERGGKSLWLVCKESSHSGRELTTEEMDFDFGHDMILNVVFVAVDKCPSWDKILCSFLWGGTSQLPFRRAKIHIWAKKLSLLKTALTKN